MAENDSKEHKTWVKYSQIGIQMALTIALGIWAGIWLDDKLSWKFPIFTVVLALLSIFASIYNVIRQLPKP